MISFRQLSQHRLSFAHTWVTGDSSGMAAMGATAARKMALRVTLVWLPTPCTKFSQLERAL
jgi:hypothetical protein